MPDANGKFKGISVPALPWHDEQPANPKSDEPDKGEGKEDE